MDDTRDLANELVNNLIKNGECYMLSLDHLMQQLASLNQRKNQATELFHQLTGAMCIIDELIKTHYPNPAPDAVQGEQKDEHVNNEATEQVA